MKKPVKATYTLNLYVNRGSAWIAIHYRQLEELGINIFEDISSRSSWNPWTSVVFLSVPDDSQVFFDAVKNSTSHPLQPGWWLAGRDRKKPDDVYLEDEVFARFDLRTQLEVREKFVDTKALGCETAEEFFKKFRLLRACGPFYD